jgi:hypothetical protein
MIVVEFSYTLPFFVVFSRPIMLVSIKVIWRRCVQYMCVFIRTMVEM